AGKGGCALYFSLNERAVGFSGANRHNGIFNRIISGIFGLSYSLRFENARRSTEMNSNFQISGGCQWTVIWKIVVKLKGGVVLI
ncbi:hypothetical protein, partial [Paramuribaculum intestinale]|uniref:hypothetical protein n=1 Tax=Paramuribaculum intestinale TaxID=2094151 RepID=UPI0025AEDF01